MKQFALIILLAPIAVALATPAFAQDSVVIHRSNPDVVIRRDTSPEHSGFGHEQWHNGRAIEHRRVFIREGGDNMRTGSVVSKKVIRRDDGMGGETTTVIKKRTY